MSEWLQAINPEIQSVLVVITAIVIYFIVRLFLLGRLDKFARSTSNDLDDRLVHFFRRFYGIAVIFLTILAVLKIHKIEISPLLAGAGIVGVTIGLAARETLADILSGIFLITDQPMRVGNRVKIEYIGRDWGGWGDVTDIGLRRTAIRNTDGVIVNYPNHLLANSVITNFSSKEESMRVRVRFQVGYDANLKKVKACAAQAIENTDGVTADSADIVIRSLWDDKGGHMLGGILMEGRYSISDIRRRTRIRSAVLENIIEQFREASIPLSAFNVNVEKWR